MKQFFTSKAVLSIFAMLSASLACGEEASVSPSIVTVRMTKEEALSFKKPEFVKSRDLSDVISSKISLLATTLTARQGGKNVRLVEITNAVKQVEHDRYFSRLGILHYEQGPQAAPDADGLRVFLLGQTRKSGEVKFKEAFPLITEIQKGLSFKLSSSSKTAKAAAASAPQIRYGLVVQDIVPEEAPGVASLGSFSESYENYSRPARVVYTIDRVEADTSRNLVFPNYVPDSAPAVSSPQPPAAPNSAALSMVTTLLSRVRRPSTDVDVKVEAANTEDSVSDKVGTGSLPGGKITLTQVDGYLSTEIITTSRLGKQSMTYDAKLPLVGEANISRKYNESFHPIATSANNLLISPSAPKLNIHRLDAENRFKGELLVKRNYLDMGVAVEPRVGWGPGGKVGQAGDRVSLVIANQF